MRAGGRNWGKDCILRNSCWGAVEHVLERLWGPVKPPLDTHQQITIYSVLQNRKKNNKKQDPMRCVECRIFIQTFVFIAKQILKWSVEDEIILDSAESVWSGLPFVLPCPLPFYLLTTAGPISKSAGPDSTIGPFHTKFHHWHCWSQPISWMDMTNYIHGVHQI